MYSWEGMRKISYEEALEVFRAGKEELYLLYDDDTESLVHEDEEQRIHDHHGYAGEFGVHK